MSRSLHLFAVILLLAACDRPGDPAKTREFAARALRGALAYPRSTVVSVAAGNEAGEFVLATPDSIGAVTAWYRRALPLNNWVIKRDVVDRSGAVTIYAEQEKRPLWITLRPAVGGTGTTFTLVGVVPDSTGGGDSIR